MPTSTTTPFKGTRATDDMQSSQVLENWRQAIPQLLPNGETPLMAFLGRARSVKTGWPKFNWFNEVLPAMEYTGTAGSFVYEDAALSDAYDSGDLYAAGTTVFVKVDTTFVNEIKIGDQLIIRDADKPSYDVNVKVISLNTTTFAVGCKLLEADTTAGGMENAETVVLIGSMSPEGSESPASVAYDPTELWNYTQIFRDSVDMTGTMLNATDMRTEAEYPRQKRNAFKRHMIKMERALIFGERSLGVGSNGKPERTTRGLIKAIADHDSSNIATYDTGGAVTWLVGGEDWLNEHLEVLFRYGSPERLAFIGSTTARALQRLAQNSGQMNLRPGVPTKWGLKVTEWLTPYGIINFRTHPQFSQLASMRDAALIFDPNNVQYRFMNNRDTHFREGRSKEKDGGYDDIDGVKEGWLTEAGLLYDFTETAMFLKGFNLDTGAA